jgi:hypothetical protein
MVTRPGTVQVLVGNCWTISEVDRVRIDRRMNLVGLRVERISKKV